MSKTQTLWANVYAKRQSLDTLSTAKSSDKLAVVNRISPFHPPVKERGEVGGLPHKRASRFIIRCTTPAISTHHTVLLQSLKRSCLSRRARKDSIPSPSGLSPRVCCSATRSFFKLILRPQRLAALIEKRKMPQGRIRSLAQLLDGLGPLLRVKAITQQIARL